VSSTRIRRAVLLSIACGLAVGCGGSRTPATVNVSITAPVDGATVVVPRIVVLGTVEPRNAVVVVSGKRAQVEHGVFKRPLLLRGRLTRIKIVARAQGYVGSATDVYVTYKPEPRPSPPRASVQSGVQSSSAQVYSGTLPSSGVAAGGLPSEVGTDFVAGCSSNGGSVGGCECVWRELTKRGFDSRAQFEALLEQWKRSFLSKGVIAYPPVIKHAILSCGADFRVG
jgi:hypothetical protein